MFDIAQWGLGMDHTGPVKYIPPKDPKVLRGLRMFYANGVEMTVADHGRNGVMFIGSEGRIFVNRGTVAGKPVVNYDNCTGCGKCEKACILEEAAIKVFPVALAKGLLGRHYRLGWDQKTVMPRGADPATLGA